MVVVRDTVQMRQDMGNICNPGQKGGSRPPRDLTGLLREAVLFENSEQKENRSRPCWEQEFRSFLQSRNQADMVSCLDFLLETEMIQLLEEEEKEIQNRKRSEEIKATKLRKLKEIGAKYFSVQSDECLPLSNQVLLEETGKTLRGLKVDQLADAVKLVMAARGDNRVWKSGLDLAYRSYLATNPTQSLQAVLLSIL